MDNLQYNSFYYWDNILQSYDDFWEEYFNKMPLTKESVFIHTVIMNYHGESQDFWMYYPNIKILLGFIEYVFMPTAYNAKILGVDNTELLIPLITVEELLEDIEAGEINCSTENIILMNNQLLKFKELWILDGDKCFCELKNFSMEFNESWYNENDIFFYFDVFRSPKEIGNSLIDNYEKCDLLQRIEDQFDVTEEELLDICDSVYENQFMKNRFIELINNKLIDMV